MSEVAGIAIMLAAVAVLCGWEFDIPAMRSLIPGLKPMNPGGSALCFLMAGAAIQCLSEGASSRTILIRRLLALGVISGAICALGNHFLGWESGFDMDLHRAKLAQEADATGHIDRMAPNTAIAFLLLGLSLLLIDVKKGKFWLAQVFCAGVVVIAIMTITGYAYNAMHLTRIQEYVPMALATALCLLTAAAGILCARPERGIMAVLSGQGVGGVMARTVLPVIVFLPAIGGWIAVDILHEAENPATAMSFFVMFCGVMLTALIWAAADYVERMDNRLRWGEERYQLAVTGTNDGIWDWDLVGGELFWSERFREILSITDPAFQPSYAEFKRRLHPEDREHIIQTLESHTRTHAHYDEEFRMLTDAGVYLWVRARGASAWNSAGRTTRMAGSLTDISFLKFSQAEELLARHRAEQANMAKSEFLANMSHELRTPLNSIIGMTRLMHEDKDLSPEHAEMSGIVYRSANNLLDTVNDILDVTKIEAGKLELDEIVFSLVEIVDATMQMMLPLSFDKGIALSCNLNADGMPYLLGDPMRLQRVMVNLIGNAIKYTERGSVTIDISWSVLAEGVCDLEFSVTDTGIGIAADKIDYIFEKFTQGDNSITRKFGGAGLGLSITRQIVEKMRGEIGVESTLGRGSRFWFHIPFSTSETRTVFEKKFFDRSDMERLPEAERINVRELKVLMAEDHMLNQALMKRLLPRLGIADFLFVENGKLAVEAYRTGKYNLVLMDCHMPVMSGYDATGAMRAHEQATGGRHVPIIAMTADAMAGTRARCLKSGMDEYITKPVDADELKFVMSRWVTFNDENAEGTDTGPAAGGGEDAVADLSSLRQFATTDEELKEFTTMFTTQGEETLAILRQNAGSGENKIWSEAAHKMKGSAGMLQAKKLQGLCAAAQEMETTTSEERQRMLKNIEDAYQEVRAFLKI